MQKQGTLIYPGKGGMTGLRKGWFGTHVSLRLPLPLLFVATPLLKQGYKVRILDLRLDPIEGHDFSGDICVGISTLTGGQILSALDACEVIKQKYPKLPIVWGGIHPTTFPEQTIASPMVDLLVKHEGEATFMELVKVLEANGADLTALKSVQGIVFKGPDGLPVATPERPFLDFDAVDLPAYELVDMNRYFGIRHTFDYQSSRGCPFNCGFCYNKVFNKLRWRARSAERVLDELKYLQRTYDVKEFAMVDDEFFIRKDRDERIVEMILEAGTTFKWSACCRFDSFSRLSDEFLVKLRSSGMEQIWMGAESGNVEMLKYMEKKITIGQIESAMVRTRRAQIRPVVSFILGSLGETDSSMEDTLALYDRCLKLNPDTEINGIFIYTPYPGAPMFGDAVENGFDPPKSLEEWGRWEYQYRVNHRWLSKAQLSRIRTIASMARFRFFSAEFAYRNRKKKSLVAAFNVLNFPMQLSYMIRWKTRLFGAALEWRLWAFLIKKAFGFI